MTKTLRVGTLTAISTLDPRRAHDFTGHVVISQVFEQLYARERDQIVPRLAAALPVRNDPFGPGGFALELRQGVRFSDGTPVSTEVVLACLRKTLAAHGIEARGSGCRIELRSDAWRVRPEELLSQREATVFKEVGERAIGTGPFAVASASPQEVRLVRNPHGWRGAAIDEIHVRCYAPSAEGRPHELLAALQAGKVDFTLSLSRDDVGSLRSVRKLFQAGMSTAILHINTERPAFAGAGARRAIALAIDRYRLAELCYENPAAFVARCALPPGLGRGNDGLRHDPRAALASLGSAPLPSRLRMVRVWGPRPYLTRPDAVAAAIAEQLRTLGVEVDTVAASDSEDYHELVAAADYDLVLGGWIADTTDPLDFLEALVGLGGVVAPDHAPVVASNYARWRDPETARLLLEARATGGTQAIDRIVARVASEVPLVPLMYGPRVIVHSWRVKGYDPDEGLMPDFARVDLDG